MICQTCGNPVETGVHFCPRCGAQVVAAPAPPPPPAYAAPGQRIERNLQTLGILWCIFGAYRIIGGLIAMLVMGAVTLTSFAHGGWGWEHHFNGISFPPIPLGFVLVPIILVIVSLTAFLALFVGYGLLKRKPWGRMLGIIVAILSLWKFPLGTALGIYTLWVLVPAESAMEYDTIASR